MRCIDVIEFHQTYTMEPDKEFALLILSETFLSLADASWLSPNILLTVFWHQIRLQR